MYSIIPLAGPDFILPDGLLKPLFDINGTPLIVKALQSREWIKNKTLKNENMIFVLRKTPQTAGFSDFLMKNFTGCKIVEISDRTQGALLSSLAGAALIKNYDIPVCVDLIDIIYNCNSSPVEIFEENPDIKGIIPYFESDSPKFSYLKIFDNRVKQTVEKRVISQNASAGTYFFKDIPTFLEGVSDSLKMDALVSYKENQFLCPSYNSLIMKNYHILPVKVENVQTISEYFH